ncbi:hypothetical protein AVEN_125519-1 [Araneus ventricosus]|uniref:Uncharacterized protein n=1 Tax=Araneus ventricosus TaxID=182803 RepID=A0A4Y2NPN4_ARAVE|nr:hypothetical protein AVEN_125519-1 [Araneus ventricosus]
MEWPPRPPDTAPLDFYLWGYVKQHVYSELINDINHLKQRITDVNHFVTPDILTRVWEELDYRLDVCRATSGELPHRTALNSGRGATICGNLDFGVGRFQVRNLIPPKIRHVWGLLHTKSYAVAKRPLVSVVRKIEKGCQLRRRPRHLTAVQNDEVRSKIALVLLQNGALMQLN